MKRVLSLFLCAVLIAAVCSGCGLFTTEENKLELDKTELSMIVGDTVVISAGGAVKVTWTSSDDKIATVNGGTVSAKSAGAAVITAALEDGTSQTCNVTVADKQITAVSLDVKSARLEAGKTIQLTATYTPTDASDTNLSWSSMDEAVAMVNSGGYVTGISDGVTNIVCTASSGAQASCTVTVGSITEAPAATTSAASKAEDPTQKSEEPKKDTENKSQGNSGASSSAAAASGSAFLFPDSSVRMLTEGEISTKLGSLSGASVSGSYAQDAVNEIFARNGYVFRTASIQAYYEAQSWYSPNPGFSVSDLNAIEEYNIALLCNY